MTQFAANHPSDHREVTNVSPRQRWSRQVRWWLILICLVGLPGCSGCQKKTAETPPKPEEVTAPPAEPAPQKQPEPQSDENEKAPENLPEAEPSEKSPATENEKSTSTAASPLGSPPAGAKSGKPDGDDPKVGTAPLPPGGAKKRASTAESGSPKPGRPPRTAAAALETARDLHAKSIAAVKVSDFGKAFDLSSQAWEALRAFPQDSECQALCKLLETELELLGDRANALVAPGDANSKRLVDQ